MRIHSLTIDNFRGIDHLELRGLPDTGVIVIHGDNEQGKSTILDALDAVLNEKHTGKSRTVKSWQPVGRDVGPAVTLHATVGPVTFVMSKQWLRGAKAELRFVSPSQAPLTSREAEERLDEILSRHLDRDLARTLFMRQDDLGSAISAVGISSVTRALDGVSGDDTDSGTEDTALTAAVEKEYERYFTARGTPARELKAAEDTLVAAEDALREATAEHAELSGHVDRHDRVTATRARAESDLPGAESEEADLAAKAAHAVEARTRAEALRRELQLATESLQRAEEAVTHRAELAAAVTEASDTLSTHTAGLPAAQERRDREKEQLDELGAELAEARKAREAAAERLRTTRREQRLVTAATRRTALRTKLEAVHDLSERIAAARTATAGRAVTDADVRAVEDATTDLTLARRLRAQSAARLELTGPAGSSITVDGTPLLLDATPTLELTEGTEVVIGEVTARYHAGHPVATGEDPVAGAERALADLLDALDLPDLEAVRAARDTHRRAAEDLAGLLRERTALLGGADEETLTAELAGLDAELDDEEIPESDPAAAARAVEGAEQAREEAESAVTQLDAALTPWRERRAENEQTALSVRIEAAEERLAQAQAALDAATAGADDVALAAAVTAATAARDEAAAASGKADADVAAADPELATALHEGAVSRLEGLRTTMTRAERDLAELTGYIRQAQGAAERLDQARSALEAAERQHDSVRRRADAVQLLRETLHRHRADARARYAQPFAEQLTRLARPVFGPDVVFTLSDQLEVTQRSVGEDTVPLADLSGGAKEQLAILTRFAIAQLTAGEGGVPVPVIIDDALGASDPTRLQLMSTLFARMGDKGQVIVLTCVPQRYERVGGRTEFAIDELKS